jgi:hypothetical protein
VWQEDGDGITLRFEFLKSSLNSDVTNHVLNDNDLLLVQRATLLIPLI